MSRQGAQKAQGAEGMGSVGVVVAAGQAMAMGSRRECTTEGLCSEGSSGEGWVNRKIGKNAK